MHDIETHVEYSPKDASSTWTLATGNPFRDKEEAQLLDQHLTLLRKLPSQYTLPEITTTPIFVMPMLRYAEALLSPGDPQPFPQYGLLGGLSEVLKAQEKSGEFHRRDPRILFNVATPSSTFICGSQGSGKSHTLSCLLENCLSSSIAGRLPSPLTGLLFHYDAFISDYGGSPCEAAFLASDLEIEVKVLCSPTNLSKYYSGELDARSPIPILLQLLTISSKGHIQTSQCRSRASANQGDGLKYEKNA